MCSASVIWKWSQLRHSKTTFLDTSSSWNASPMTQAFGSPPGTISRTRADMARATEVLGLGPRTQIEEGMRKTLQSFVQDA